MKLKVLDLFSGLGGFSLGLERTGHFKTIAFCDNNRYCNLVLQKHWKGVKIYNDVKEITKERLEADGVELPEIITGGFPCQPFSVAGKQKGTSDDRYLWPEMFRIIQELTPRWVIGENVKGLTNIQDGVVFETVCSNLEGEGYEVRTFNIPAAGVGAPHRRERLWIVAHRKESMVNTDDVRLEQHIETKEEASRRRSSATFESTSTTNVVNTLRNDEGREISRGDEETRGIQKEHRTENSTTRQSSRTSEIRKSDNGYEDVADTDSRLCGRGRTESQSGEDSEGRIHSKEEEQTQQHLRSEALGRNSIRGETKDESSRGSTIQKNWFDIEPDVGRVAHGIQGRVHRLKGLGNAIVPQIAEEIGRAIIKAERE